MSLHLKSGPDEVRVFGLTTAMVLAIVVAEGAYRELGFPCYVTGALDGKHKAGSSHYTGNAADVRTSMLTEAEAKQMVQTLTSRLTSDYLVLLEGDHIHIQFKPQNTYTG